MTKIKVKKKAADWAVFSFLKAAQIWSTRPMRYSPVQADQKKPNTPISRSRHFEIESEAPVGRNPEVTVNNNDLDYQPRAATAI